MSKQLIDKTIAITGMNAIPDNPGPGLAVARCLRSSTKFRGRIIGLGYDALDPGLYNSHFCDAAYLIPYPSTGDEAILDSLKKIKLEENVDILLPCLDAELPALVRLLPLLEELGLKLFLPTQEQLRLRNKDQLKELAQIAGIHCPNTKAISSAGFFYKCQNEGWTFPLVVKGLFYDARIVNSADEAADAFKEIAAAWGFPILVQKLVSGEEYNLTAVGDGKGHMIGEVMMKKMATTNKGKAWAGISIVDNTLYTAAKKIVHSLNWRGPLEVEVIRDHQGRYQLIEINPRFPAWIYLSVGVGRNLPLTLLQLTLNIESSKLPDAKPGVIFIRYAQECIVSITEFETMVMHGGRKLLPNDNRSNL